MLLTDAGPGGGKSPYRAGAAAGRGGGGGDERGRGDTLWGHVGERGSSEQPARSEFTGTTGSI